MKNMKKLLQKAMVFTLSAAMLVGTPMTVSAAGLVDLYSIDDGSGNKEGSGNVGTVTNTDTNTGFLIGENAANIVGIELDRKTVNAEVGTNETLKATVVLDRDLGDDTDAVVEELSKKVRWEVLYLDADGKPVEKNTKPNPADKVELDGKADNRSEITLIPHHGTGDNEKVTVRATIDASYYYDNGIKMEDKDDARKDAVYTAEATVTVKEYSTELAWKDKNKADTLELKHTLDLGDLLVRTPKTANDAITWVSSNPGAAAVSATGVVTAKKVTAAGADVKITAVSEHGAVAERTITVIQGVKADVVKVFVDEADQTGKTIVKDIATDARSMTVTAKMYAKVSAYKDAEGKLIQSVETDGESGEAKLPDDAKLTKNVEIANGESYIDKDGVKQTVNITDTITWSSNKPAVATVDADGNVTLKTVGTAAITAKATNGKSAKTNVKVAASLNKLAISGVENGKTYDSGRTINLVAVRNGGDLTNINKDAVKWSILKVGNRANPNATINAKGVLKIANKVTDNVDVTIHLETTKKIKNENNVMVPAVQAEDVTIKVKQNDVDVITVTDSNNDVVARGGFGTDNKKLTARTTDNPAVSKTEEINVTLAKTYKATAQQLGDNGEWKNADASKLTWKTSNAKVAAITATGAKATIKAVGAGTATITVSGIRVNEKGTASALNVTFKVKVKQPVTTLTMNKPTVTMAQKNKVVKGAVTGQQDQKVTLQVTFGPKNADKSQKKIDSWAVYKNGKMIAGPVMTTGKKPAVNTAAKLTYNLEGPKAGDVYKITAKSITGATATSVVTIVEPTTEIAIVKTLKDGEIERFTTEVKGKTKTNETVLTIGTDPSLTMQPVINIGTAVNKVKPTTPPANWVAAGTNNTEQVTYTVNKKGIVTIDKDGNVYAVKKGVVTITAKTPTGKKATLKVTVN